MKNFFLKIFHFTCISRWQKCHADEQYWKRARIKFKLIKFISVFLKEKKAPSLIQAHWAMRNLSFEFFLFYAMAAYLCKEREISFSNNIQFSDFIDDKYFSGNEGLKGPYTFQRRSLLRKTSPRGDERQWCSCLRTELYHRAKYNYREKFFPRVNLQLLSFW